MFKNKINTSELKNIVNAGLRVHRESFNASKSVYIGLILVTIFTATVPYLSSYLSGKIIDSLILYLELSSSYARLVQLVSLFILVVIVERLASLFYRYLDTVQWVKLYNYFSIRLAAAYSKLDIAHYESKKYSDLISKAQESFSGRVVNFLSRSLGLVSDVISMAVGFSIVFFISPILFFIVVIFSFPDFITDLIFGRAKYGVWDGDTEVRRKYWEFQHYLRSSRYLKEVKTFASRNFLLRQFKELLLEFQDNQLKIERKRFVTNSSLSLLAGLSFGLIYFVVIRKVLIGEITIGSFTFYIASVRALSNSITSFLRNLSRNYEDGLYAHDLYKSIDLKPLIKEGTKSYKNTKAPKIEFKNVTFKYPFTKPKVFSGLDLKIKPGEHVAIVGENGAGKTTLISLLCRFYDATDGSVLINGENIKNFKQESWHKNIALLSQDFARYFFDVKTNIAMSDIGSREGLHQVKDAAKQSGADVFVKKLDKKYDTLLDKRFTNGTELSTGQWQKVALARAFYKNSPILILDEPTSAIDPKSEYEIFEKLFDFAKDKTVIIISHRFSTVRNADRIIVLDDGKIVEEGSHKQLIKLNGMYKEAFDLQKKGYEDV